MPERPHYQIHPLAVSRIAVVPTCLCLAIGLFAGIIHAQQVDPEDPHTSTNEGTTAEDKAQEAEAAPVPFCVYPKRPPRPVAEPQADGFDIDESEPNSAPIAAQVLPLGPGLGMHRAIDVTGILLTDTDLDFYRISAARGDVIGVAAVGGPLPNLVVAITDTAGTLILQNNLHEAPSALYPPVSPLPVGADPNDAALSWIAPADGDFLIRVSSFDSLSNGPYSLLIRSSRPAFALQNPPEHQIVYIDFDGATINADQIFGFGESSATLSPLTDFLPNWGLNAGNEDAVIDAILDTVFENYDDLRSASLNGNRPTDSVAGHFDVEFRNSRDHADPWGQPNVSRVIVGGTKDELGIDTIGIAQFIDPGNFSREDTAVVLLDAYSEPAISDPFESSINSVALDPSVTIIDAIGLAVGYTVSHEAGHFFGCWHTENGNSTSNIMDRGGIPTRTRVGAGPDGILGTADDIDVDFVSDDYESEETAADGIQNAPVRTAFGLSTGAFTIFVNAANDSGIEFGTVSSPYDTVTEGHNAYTPGGKLFIIGGNYPETLLFATPGFIDTVGGTVLIGP